MAEKFRVGIAREGGETDPARFRNVASHGRSCCSLWAFGGS
jgi:hypothetical protein